MGFALSTNFRGHSRVLLWACLVALALSWLGPAEVRAVDAVGLEVAADEARLALDEMAVALNAAPQDTQTAISADLHLMSQAITRALGRLEHGPVPIVDPTLVYDLNLLTDVVMATTAELQSADPDGGLAADRAESIDALADAAAARVVEINLVIDGWTERARNAVVELAEVDGELVVRSTDRLIYNGVRYTSIGLLLVGLLVVGIQLLRMSEDRVDSFALLRETPVLSGLAITVLTVFFAGCVVFSLHPGVLATLSAEVRQQPQEHPCEQLAEQRDRLIAAQQVRSRGLVEATKARMVPAARDCLGLPTATATAEALDLLAAKTAVAYREPALPSTPDFAVAAVDDEEEPASTAGRPSPSVNNVLADPTESTELDDPADLAVQLEKVQRALKKELEQFAPSSGPAPTEDVARPAATPEPEAPADEESVDDSPQPAPSAPETRPAVAPAPQTVPDEADAELFVTTTALNYRAGPSLQARRLGTLVPGAQLEVIGEDDDWSKVRLFDGREVFVATQFLQQAR